jgi:hypothetical protein
MKNGKRNNEHDTTDMEVTKMTTVMTPVNAVVPTLHRGIADVTEQYHIQR